MILTPPPLNLFEEHHITQSELESERSLVEMH